MPLVARKRSLTADDKDDGAEQEHDGRKHEGEPISDVLRGVGHRNLTNQSTNVDEEVEPIVDACGRDSGIDDDALALLGRCYLQLLEWDLLGDEG